MGNLAVTPIYQNAPVNQPADAAPKTQVSAVSEPAAAEQTPAAQPAEQEPSVQPTKNEEPKKDYRYVQELLDKIAELEQSSDTLSMEEIKKLRTEVDEAIEAMQEE